MLRDHQHDRGAVKFHARRFGVLLFHPRRDRVGEAPALLAGDHEEPPRLREPVVRRPRRGADDALHDIARWHAITECRGRATRAKRFEEFHVVPRFEHWVAERRREVRYVRRTYATFVIA